MDGGSEFASEFTHDGPLVVDLEPIILLISDWSIKKNRPTISTTLSLAIQKHIHSTHSGILRIPLLIPNV